MYTAPTSNCVITIKGYDSDSEQFTQQQRDWKLHIVLRLKTVVDYCLMWIDVMGSVRSLLLLFLLSLVEVHCQQTLPYVSFMGQTLDNHSYVDLSTVGSASDNSDGVVCHSDLHYCCSVSQGVHRGNWSFPNGTVLPFSGNSVPIAEGRSAQRVVIRRTNDATGYPTLEEAVWMLMVETLTATL